MKPVHEMSVAEALEVANRRTLNRQLGRPLDALPPLTGMATFREHEVGFTIDLPPEDDDERLEKAIEHEADKQLRALGFEVVKFSHPGRTKQTPGIADRRYYHRGRRLAFWWEAKSPTGRQRPDQKLFQEMCDASGDLYVLGTDQDLFRWLVEQGIAARVEGGLLIALPYDRTQGTA
jgi:hypothetical protein